MGNISRREDIESSSPAKSQCDETEVKQVEDRTFSAETIVEGPSPATVVEEGARR